MTLKDDQMQLLGRLEGKLDALLSRTEKQDATVNALALRLRDTEVRLSVMEAQRATTKDIYGRTMAVAAIALSLLNVTKEFFLR